MTTGFAVCGMPFPGEGFTVGASGPPGSGTVTSVSVVTANGVSGTVATPTTTPAITITLGNITPTSVNTVVISGASTPTLTVTGTTTVSGSNTGDQIEFPDNTFRVYDNVDTTKKVAFEVSTVTTATTRTLTVPDVNGTITLNTAPQTLTNKTVVTPIIQTGMDLVGGTSGTVTIDVPAIITDYTLILPPAQGTGSLTNDGAGNLSWGGTTGIVGWTPALNTSVPNNTVNASTFTASGGTTNQDAVIQPKGTGAFILQLPDNTATGGNKRGDHAIDLQTGRSVATSVASGPYSFVAGYDNTANNNMSIAIGNGNTSTNSATTAIGVLNVASGTEAVAIGGNNTASGGVAVAIGKENLASGQYATIIGGLQNIASGDSSVILGGRVNSNAGDNSVVMGQGFTFTSAADNSFGFLSNPLQALNMTIAAPNTAVFGNVNMWLANNDNTARELRFYEPYNATGAFPNTANYTAFKAGVQSADVTYTLPVADGTSGNILTTNGSGTLSWSAPTSGTVTSVSVVTANGFGGTVATPTTTPAITITTGVTGILKGNGTGVSAAVLGTDYSLIQYWTESLNTTGVNTTVPAVQWLATNSATDVDAVIAPKAQGALLAQVPDGTTVGGDKRGLNATDFQRLRTNNLQVASGLGSVIVGGRNNTATASYSAVVAGSTNQANGLNGFVGGGNNNRADAAASAVAGGSICIASGVSSFVGSGSANVASGYASVVTGGNDNVASGSNAVISGGYNNNATGDNTTIIGGQELTISGVRSVGYNSSPSYTTPTSISAPDVAVYGNVDLWLANTRNAASKLKFFTAQSTTGAFPTGSTYYTSFEAGVQSANVTYILPIADGSSGNVLSTNGSGVLSWASPGGGGTVTTISVVTANGISGSVANPTTTPAITLALAGITPSLNTASPNNTVNASMLLASGGTTNQDLVLSPKADGAIQAQLADNTASGGNKRGIGAIDLQRSRTAATQVASGTYSAAVGGYSNTVSGIAAVVIGGDANTASNQFAAVIGGSANVASGVVTVAMGHSLTLSGSRSFGFNGNSAGYTNPMTVSADNTAVFGNVNMWLANNDNTARELRFYEPYNTTGAFPNTANYTAFKAQAQSADVTYTLPAADGSNGNVLTTNGSGALSWTTAAAGTVTTVSVVMANGVSGSVANATTTPAITITLGAITPTTVNGMTITTTTGTLTLASGSSLVTSGANSITFTSTGPTTVTLPTTGTLMANPMTTGGDVIYGGASGAPTRLANGSNGQFLTSSGGTSAPTWTTPAGLTGFTDSLNTSAPNNLINSSMLLASGGTTNQNAVLSPKGTGAFQLQLADSTSTGGNVRGANAIDLQMSRSSASQVASGQYSFAAGSQNTASGTNAVALGDYNEVTGNYAGALGQYHYVPGNVSFAFGTSNVVTGNGAIAMGSSCYATAEGTVSIGSRAYASYYGQFAQAAGMFAGPGDAQISNLVARNITTNATQTELFLDGSSIQLGVPSNKTYAFEVRVSGRRTDTPGSSYHAVIEGTISNNSGTTALDGLNTMRVITNTAGTWSAVVEADNTNDALVVKVTGASGATISWVAAIKLVEVAS